MRSLIVIVAIILLAQGCRKKEEASPVPSPDSPIACDLAAKLKKRWIWDSTIYVRNDSTIYAFTNAALKTYTAGTTDTLVRTICSFSLDLRVSLNDQTGCTRRYTQSLPDSSHAQGIIEGRYRKYDSVYYVKDNMSWIVSQLKDSSGEYLWIEMDDYFYHEGSSIVGWIIFQPGNFDIEKLSGVSLVLYPLGDDRTRQQCYFHTEQ